MIISCQTFGVFFSYFSLFPVSRNLVIYQLFQMNNNIWNRNSGGYLCSKLLLINSNMYSWWPPMSVRLYWIYNFIIYNFIITKKYEWNDFDMVHKDQCTFLFLLFLGIGSKIFIFIYNYFSVLTQNLIFLDC